MAPDYSVKWWKSHEMTPPEIDVCKFFERKLEWRYGRGIPKRSVKAEAFLGDAREILNRKRNFKADFVLTSPPYCGVTNYEYDNWIRLWMLGGPALPSFGHAARYEDKQKYRELINGVFTATKRLTCDDAAVYVRTDAREFTLQVTVEALLRIWPKHSLYGKSDKALGPTQTALFGNPWIKAGEVDLIMIAHNGQTAPLGFELLKGI
jgi:hypothetical protein